MAEVAQSGGLLDLEKELTCSICMQVLHQPLTLLDCLHTFCGFCLKEWFALQASRASSSNPNPISCPSCRAPVRDTRPDAKVTTLLDMYLQANPSRARDKEEKEEIKSKYTPGENVLPRIRRRRESSDQAEDRRMVDEVREMSLREVGIRGSGSYERGIRHRARDGARDARDEDARQQRRDRERRSSSGGGEETARPSSAADAANQARQIGHQSSLRSLLSTSDLDSSEMEEEILRQIMDEGILDGIDLNNIDVGQEDELSEKIAEAYRRRHGRMSRSQDTRAEHQRVSNSHGQRSDSNELRQQRRPGRSPNPTDQTTHSSHPPVSRPHLLEAYPTGQGHRRRTSSETRRQTSPTPPSSSSRTVSETQRQAARSATDLSNRPQSSHPATRSATDLSARPQNSSNQRIRPRDISNGGRRTIDPTNIVVSAPRTSASDPPRAVDQNNQHVSRQSDGPRLAGREPNEPRVAAAVSTSQPLAELPVPSIAQVTYLEPSVSCERCGKVNMEHELHMNCDQCIEEPFDESHIPLTFRTKCDICTYPIPPSTTRFHCPQCNDGDYDICTTCYLRLVQTGRINAENGPRGWRRCPNGHRMIVIGFEDSVQGQRRIVLEDLVGGHALNDTTDSEGKVWRWRDETQRAQAKTMSKAVNGRSSSGPTPHPNDMAGGKYPPNGGVGMRVLAMWSYWPQEGVVDELAFPKGAEIRECEDINGDWFLGVYCGRKGVFPGNYCRILENVAT
ncbi:MAG: hypothetical protein Q9161_002115 [Pseudevernia consocians]